LDKLKVLSDRNEFKRGRTPEIEKKGWCGEFFRSKNFFSRIDNSVKSSAQKSKLLKWFTNSNNNKLRNLNDEDDVNIYQRNDKKIITTRTTEQLYFRYYNWKKKTSFKEVDDWTRMKIKIIIVNILDEKYSIDIKHYHKIGDLRKTIGLWVDIQPDKIVFENGVSLFDDPNIWKRHFKETLSLKLIFNKTCF
jgi:hypothetical protein